MICVPRIPLNNYSYLPTCPRFCAFFFCAFELSHHVGLVLVGWIWGRNCKEVWGEVRGDGLGDGGVEGGEYVGLRHVCFAYSGEQMTVVEVGDEEYTGCGVL